MISQTHFFTAAEPTALRRLSDRIGASGRQISGDLDGLARGHLTLVPGVKRSIEEAKAVLADAEALLATLPEAAA